MPGVAPCEEFVAVFRRFVVIRSDSFVAEKLIFGTWNCLMLDLWGSLIELVSRI